LDRYVALKFLPEGFSHRNVRVGAKMSKKKNGKRELTPRQRELVRQLAKGQSQKSAAIKAGYSPKAADQSAYQAIQQIKKRCRSSWTKRG
jgi:DNA-binding NarL/FixJ family response regulator